MIQFSARGGVDVIEWIGKKEWYQLPLSAKIESLRFLVDLVCTSPVARSHIDGLEEQLRSCYASEKEEIAAKKKIMTKLARNKAGSGKSGGGADSDSDSDDGKDGTVPAEFDHLFVRDDTQLQHMELQSLWQVGACPSIGGKVCWGKRRCLGGKLPAAGPLGIN